MLTKKFYSEEYNADNKAKPVTKGREIPYQT